MAGNLYVHSVRPRDPEGSSGLTFHPVHLSNHDNYYIRIWGTQDEPQDRALFGKEVRDTNHPLQYFDFPRLKTGKWHSYRIDVHPGSRIRFQWNGQWVMDETDPGRSFSAGPVGMRLDYFDTTLDETCVYQPVAKTL